MTMLPDMPDCRNTDCDTASQPAPSHPDQDRCEPPRTFTVVADDQATTVEIAELNPDSPRPYTLRGCRRVVAIVENVFDWPECTFINLVYRLRAIQPQGRLQIDGSEAVDNPFAMLLDGLSEPADAERHARGRLILYDIAAIFYKDRPMSPRSRSLHASERWGSRTSNALV